MKFFVTLLCFFPSLTLAESGLNSLEKAYQEELAFLLAEKSSLKKQLNRHQYRFKKRLNQSKRQLAILEKKLADTEESNRKLAVSLEEAERDLAGKDKDGRALEEVQIHAKALIERAHLERGVEEDKGTLKERLEYSLSMGIQGLKRLSSHYFREGDFYLSNGKLQRGNLYHVGAVASYASVEGKSFILIPAGEQSYRAWRETSTPDAQKAMELYIYENFQKALAIKEGKTWIETFNAGGAIARVVVVLGFIAFFYHYSEGLFAQICHGGEEIFKKSLDTG